MQKYVDIGGDSGIEAYQIQPDGIVVQFKIGGVYLYNNSSAGPRHIEQMKRLASAGDGLNTYINQNVRKQYAAKLR
jgi:hypothetical protein